MTGIRTRSEQGFERSRHRSGRAAQSSNPPHTVHRPEHPMLDVILVAAALGFFALSIGYTIACDRL
jgi:hypothetical protein